jgi:hypothetical protein
LIKLTLNHQPQCKLVQDKEFILKVVAESPGCPGSDAGSFIDNEASIAQFQERGVSDMEAKAEVARKKEEEAESLRLQKKAERSVCLAQIRAL